MLTLIDLSNKSLTFVEITPEITFVNIFVYNK